MHFVDLFCGAGGASCGARMAGMRVALAVDACPTALRAHARNHPTCAHVCAELPCEIALPPGPLHIHASPPCQAVSRAQRGDNAPCAARRSEALALVRWAVRFCVAHGTTWSLEQVGSPEVRAVLREEGVDFDVFDLSRLGVAQTRRRLIAGPRAIVEGLRAVAARNDPPVGVSDVVPACRGTHVRNCTTNTFVVRDGVREQVPVTEDNASFARDVARPTYTVTGRSPLRWWTPGDARCATFTPRELALVQGFPPDYLFDETRADALVQVGNAVPPPVLALVCAIALRCRASSAR